MTYRVYCGPPGSEDLSALDKDRVLFKEMPTLDDALGWARHIHRRGVVTLRIEGDDGTIMSKRDIAAALTHSEGRTGEPPPVPRAI
jgi:hypothetical protein